MSFWNFIGLASKKDFEEVSRKLSDMTGILDTLTKQSNSVSSSIGLVEERMNIISETSSNELSSVNKELNSKITFTNDSLEKLITMADIKSKISDLNYESTIERLKSIEALTSELFEAVKIIWVDNMVENLKIINTK